MAWLITVATAAPLTPMSKTKIKTGSRIIFATAPITIESIAVPAKPCAFIKGLRPMES